MIQIRLRTFSKHTSAILLLLSTSKACFAASADTSLMTLPSSSTTQSMPGIPMSAVFDESLVNSPRVANIRAQLGITKAAYAQAKTLPNPSFFFLQDTAQRATQIGAAVPLEPPWKLVFRLLLAKAQLKQTDIEIQRNLWQLRVTVRRAYLDAVIANETKDTLTNLYELASNLLYTAQRRKDAGDVAAFDVNRAELATLQTEADLKQSEKRIEQTTQRLSVLIGRNYKSAPQVQRLPQFQLRGETNELVPNLSQQLPSLESLIEEALKSRLELKITRQAIAVNEANTRIAVGNIVPNPQINVGSSYSGNPPDGPSTRGFFIGVTQEMPILNRQQGDRARLKAVNIQLTREIASTSNVVTEEVVSAYQQLSSARERVGYFQTKILPKSDIVAKMARRGYEVGQNDITSTLAAQQANVQIKAAYLDAVRAYQQAFTDLEQAVGHPL